MIGVDLVGHQHDRHVDGPQSLADGLIQRRDAVGDVDHENDHVGAVKRIVDLRFDVFLELVGIDDADPAGIDRIEVEVIMFDHGVDPVAGDAGARIYDTDLAAGQRVQQRTLADVGSAYDSDGW